MLLFPILLITCSTPLFFYLYTFIGRFFDELDLNEEQQRLLFKYIRYTVWSAQATACGVVLLIEYIKPYFLGR